MITLYMRSRLNIFWSVQFLIVNDMQCIWLIIYWYCVVLVSRIYSSSITETWYPWATIPIFPSCQPLAITTLFSLLLGVWVLYAAAAATKSLQSCPALCDSINSSSPGSSVPGILQARILEWVAISFSNTCVHAKSLQSGPALCDPIDSSSPGSSVPGILQARILEWVAISFSNICW